MLLHRYSEARKTGYMIKNDDIDLSQPGTTIPKYIAERNKVTSSNQET